MFLFLQGHPEYDCGSLLREYRRDVGRFLRGEREHYPALPQDYFDEGAASAAKTFRKLALDARREDMMNDFPLAALEAGLAGTAPVARSIGAVRPSAFTKAGSIT